MLHYVRTYVALRTYVCCITYVRMLHYRFRYLGSAALSMCMTAMGSADGYSEYGIHCWDIAAGDIIVREAGGVTMGPTG